MSRLIVWTLFSATFSWAFWQAPIFSTQVQFGRHPHTEFERFSPSEVGGWILTAGDTWERSVLTSRYSLIFLLSSGFTADAFKLSADHEPGD